MSEFVVDVTGVLAVIWDKEATVGSGFLQLALWLLMNCVILIFQAPVSLLATTFHKIVLKCSWKYVSTQIKNKQTNKKTLRKTQNLM